MQDRTFKTAAKYLDLQESSYEKEIQFGKVIRLGEESEELGLEKEELGLEKEERLIKPFASKATLFQGLEKGTPRTEQLGLQETVRSELVILAKSVKEAFNGFAVFAGKLFEEPRKSSIQDQPFIKNPTVEKKY